ncbi:hypothetical protein [Streptomyces sp. NPDC048473]|uniref:hypothetical protein n=1 Tax=unclassified Streptomyces TaxID=2593676 RepID=UPI0037170725
MSRAFGELAAHWSDILMRPAPTAYAWDLFAGIVRHHTKRLRISTTSPLQYEIVVLHHIARCTIDRTSDTTGHAAAGGYSCAVGTSFAAPAWPCTGT